MCIERFQGTLDVSRLHPCPVKIMLSCVLRKSITKTRGETCSLSKWFARLVLGRRVSLDILARTIRKQRTCVITDCGRKMRALRSYVAHEPSYHCSARLFFSHQALDRRQMKLVGRGIGTVYIVETATTTAGRSHPAGAETRGKDKDPNINTLFQRAPAGISRSEAKVLLAAR